MDPVFLALGVPLLPALLALCAPALVRARPLACGVASAVALAVASAVVLAAVPDAAVRHLGFEWLPRLGIDFALRVDSFGAWFSALILGLGACVLLHACAYFAGNPRLPFLLAALAFFTLAMLGVVVSDNLYLLFLFWEATSLLSFLLVGFDDRQATTRAKASQALMVTMAGGAAMLAGFILLHAHFGSASISAILASEVPAATLGGGAVVLVIIGALAKSAQWPFHFWLPNAMVGPTPVSAFLHSATMVKAGVFLLATLAPVLSAHPLWTPLLAGSGILTVGTAILRAAREDDLKAILASTTLAALGFLTLLAGLGTPAALLGFVIFLTAHALYKAPLFLAVGNLEKRFGTRRLSELGGVIRHAPVTALVLGVSAFSLIGLAPLPGFLGKEYLLKATWSYSPMLAVAVALAAAGVLALGFQLALPLFVRQAIAPPRHEVPPAMTLAALLPALGALVLMGSLPLTRHDYLGAAATALGGPAGASYKLWHGWTPALGLGLGALVVALVVWRVLRSPVLAPLPASFAPVFEPFFENLLDAIRGLAAWTGGALGGGRLSTHLAVVLGSVGLLALVSLKVHRFAFPELDPSPGSAVPWLLAPVIAVAAITAARARQPVVMLVSLGFVGLLVAFLFLWFRAPDLALTQLLVETLLLFLLAGVLWKAKERTDEVGEALPGRSLLAALGGLTVTLLILKAMALEWGSPVSDFHLGQSKPAAYGANVVNVILVDFRALDTLGEIVVLGIAALGLGSALGAARRRATLPGGSDSAWLRTGSRWVVALLLPLSLWVLWRGHNAPGGGFIGALVAASGIGLATLVGLPRATAGRLRGWSRPLVVSGLGLALVTALLPLAVGRPFFTGLWWHSGELHLGTPLLFDLGVFLAVLGFALTCLRHFQPNPR